MNDNNEIETIVNFTMPVFNRYCATQKSLIELRKTYSDIKIFAIVPCKVDKQTFPRTNK